MRNIILGCLTAGLIGFTSCSDDSDVNDNIGEGTARLSVRLTDSPADYEEVNVDIQSITVNTGEGWRDMDFDNPGIYNLLEFNNGLDTLLTRADIPAGYISQMRMVLGDNNSIVADGVEYPLQTPSAQQSGLKFNIHEDFEENTAYNLWIDFDAGASVVQQGNGGYSLRPVIRTFMEDTNGQIRGYVLPSDAETTIYVMQGEEQAAVGIPAGDGFFLIRGLEEGTYALQFDAANESYTDQTMENVNVSFGNVNDIGSITMEP